MSSGTGARALKIGTAGLLGCALSVLAVWHSGIAAAVPAAFGLTALAATDLASRRLPSRIVLSTFLATLAVAAWDASRTGNWFGFVQAWAVVGAVTIVSLLVWALTSGIAFGDVKLLGVASFIPALIAPHLVLSMVIVALLASLVVIGIRRLRGHNVSRSATIAFAPPLLVGWLVAVMAS